MEMSSNLNIPELHVAQQRRRDKLRFQHLQELQANTNFHHHNHDSNGNNNINTSANVASPIMLLSPEMFNYAVAATPPPSLSSTHHLPNIHPTRFVAPSSSDSCNPQHHHHQQQSPPFSWVPSFVHNQVDYHSSHDDETPEIEYQSSVPSWGACGNNNDNSTNYNELPLLPGNFAGHHHQPFSAAIPSSYARHRRGLSLSLSSNQICGEYQPHQLGDQRELKPLELGTMSSVMKLDCGSSNSSHNNVQDDVAGSSSIHVHRNIGPLGPFTGYAAILKSSKFLKPAQHLLDELFGAAGVRRVGEDSENDLGSRDYDIGDCSTAMVSRFRGSSDDLVGRSGASCESYMPDCHERKAKLLHMQEEVCKRQKQYHQQMQMVLSAFESVPGLSNATPYISRSLKTISRHFRCLKNAIADQLRHIKRALGEDLSSPTSFLKGDTSNSLRYDQNFAKAKSGAIGGTGHVAHQTHVWRPQRGLPERAVSVLRAWLFDHFLHPYPTDNDKQMLATQTGLTRNQVSNWFINARVRLWKPMVEEIHTLETKDSSHSEPSSSNNSAMSTVIAKNRQLVAGNKFSDCKPPLSPACDTKQLECSAPSNSRERSRGREASTEQLFQKCSRIETHHQALDSMDNPYISFLPYQRRGLDLGDIGVVSLTLGLRQGSDTTQQQLQHQFVPQGIPFGGHVIHDFSG